MDERTAAELDEIRRAVLGLINEWLAAGRFTPSCDSWLRRYDLDFTKAMAELGLIGISWPVEYGGGGRSGLARLVVTEELLRVGAPVAAHWIADRQIGPSILQHGTDTAKKRYLPGIARGEVTFCLGMSETESGSDLASVRTTATRVGDRWIINGRKIWTSQAHRSTHAYVLARTGKGDGKHEGLSEFLVDMSHPGVEVRPIYDLSGEHHFNEVTFDAVPVNDDHVLGQIGAGWTQVTDQLSLERGGIERVLSTYPLLAVALDQQGAEPDLTPDAAAHTGEMLARMATVRAMAFNVAAAIDAGRAPIREAAMLKDLGTTLEREVIEFARRVLDTEADPTQEGPANLLAQAVLAAPGFTIRGGTTEVLRTVIARGVTGSMARSSAGPDDLREVVDQVLAGRGEEPAGTLPDTWDVVRDLGWTLVGVDEEHGGAGGELADVVAIVEGLGRHSVSLPLAETILARRVLAAAGRHVADTADVCTVAISGPSERIVLLMADSGAVLTGTVARVPWGVSAGEILVYAKDVNGADVAVRVPASAEGLRWTSGVNLAGEPRDRLDLVEVRVDVGSIIRDVPAPEVLVTTASLLRAAAITGALTTALTRTVEHVTTREQFGRPLIRFQAVAALLASLASEVECAKVSLSRAVAAVRDGDHDARTRVAVARVMAGRAATEGARVAHQLHAAMGVTREHSLHLSTRRLWSWRDEFGTERAWAERLGRHLLGLDADQRWQWVTEQRTKGTP